MAIHPTDEAFEPLQAKIREADMEVLQRMVDKFADQFRTEVSTYIEHHMADDLAYNVSVHATNKAESMIRSLLAGDDRDLMTVLSIHPSSWVAPWFVMDGHEVSGWKFLRMVVDRFPEQLRNQRMEQLEYENKCLKDHLAGLRAVIKNMREELDHGA